MCCYVYWTLYRLLFNYYNDLINNYLNCKKTRHLLNPCTTTDHITSCKTMLYKYQKVILDFWCESYNHALRIFCLFCKLAKIHQISDRFMHMHLDMLCSAGETHLTFRSKQEQQIQVNHNVINVIKWIMLGIQKPTMQTFFEEKKFFF